MSETELTRSRQKELARLHRRRERERHGVFLVEGVRSVEAAIGAQASLEALLVTHKTAENDRVATLLGRAHQRGIVVHHLSERDLARITTVTNGQGLAAVAYRIVQEPHALHASSSVLVLDGVQDPGNVGTLIRTAAWFGVEGVLAGPGTADIEAPKVVRSAMGGLWDVVLAQATDLVDTLGRFVSEGWHVVAADLEGTPAASWQPSTRTALVLGSEAHGVSAPVLSIASERVTIQGRAANRSGVESLNVALAGGILLHRWRGGGVEE